MADIQYVILKSMSIKELKGLKNCSISFESPITAIMGVNGIGKSTIIHALSCSFKPLSEKGERSKFSSFFPKSPNGEWKNSKFFLDCEIVNQDGENIGNKVIEYGKAVDRWTPRYDRQLSKNIHYIGISSCTPNIENFKGSSISYKTSECMDKNSKKIIAKAAAILNKDYECLTQNVNEKTVLRGVKTKENLFYSSLSMGAGEQRVIKIISVIMNADPYSLILIDEIDLLLHPDALKKLIQEINSIAEERNLQIVFTTHSLVMNELKNMVSIKYLDWSSDKVEVYNDITSMAWKTLGGIEEKPIKVFVEDRLARAIVRKIARELNIFSKLRICLFGAAGNAFTLAASSIIRNENCDNTLIVLDGDLYRTEEEKLDQLKKKYSGTEESHDCQLNKACKMITQFVLPENKQPEEYLHELLCRNADTESEIIREAKRIKAVKNKHDWIDQVVAIFDEDYDSAVNEIINECSKDSEWETYITNIYEWLKERTNI